jgi:hypothetical protein
MIGYNAYTIDKSGYMVQYPNTETITAPSVIKQNTTITHTVATAETKIFSQLIPAGTFQANDIFYWCLRIGATSNANTKIFRVYFNDTDDLVSPTIIATTSVTNQGLSVTCDREFVFKGSLTSQEILPATTSIFYHFTSTTAPTALTIDFTTNQYFVVSCQLANGADIGYIYGIKSLISR